MRELARACQPHYQLTYPSNASLTVGGVRAGGGVGGWVGGSMAIVVVVVVVAFVFVAVAVVVVVFLRRYLKLAMAQQKQQFADERKAWRLEMEEQRNTFEGEISLLKGAFRCSKGARTAFIRDRVLFRVAPASPSRREQEACWCLC